MKGMKNKTPARNFQGIFDAILHNLQLMKQKDHKRRTSENKCIQRYLPDTYFALYFGLKISMSNVILFGIIDPGSVSWGIIKYMYKKYWYCSYIK